VKVTSLGDIGREDGRGYRLFRVNDEGAEYRIEAKGTSYVWTCECRAFHDGLRTGISQRHCSHITVCIAWLGSKIVQVKETGPDVRCPCGAYEAEKHQKGGIIFYRYGRCGISFRRSAESPVPNEPPVQISSVIGGIHACTRCGSNTSVKAGKIAAGKQLYKCTECKRSM